MKRTLTGTGFLFLAALAVPLTSSTAGAEPEFPGPDKAVGFTNEVIAKIELSRELPEANGRIMRLNYLVLEPGGNVPVHSHVDRPAILYVIQGEIVEHRSDSDKPHVIRAGDPHLEIRGFKHWVENKSDQTAIFISADLFNAGDGEKLSYGEIRENYGLDPNK